MPMLPAYTVRECVAGDFLKCDFVSIFITFIQSILSCLEHATSLTKNAWMPGHQKQNGCLTDALHDTTDR